MINRRPFSQPNTGWEGIAYASKSFFAAGLLLFGFCMQSHAEHGNIQLANAQFFSPEESLLVNALHHWEDNNATLASTSLESLLLLAPKFDIAQSLQKLVQQQPDTEDLGLYATVIANTADEATREEFQQRYNYFLKPVPSGRLPSNLLRLSEKQRHAVAVDLQRNRIYLFENRQQQTYLVADLYAGIGSNGIGKQVEGDKKTPIGVYFVTAQLADSELDELYGIGAFPVNYPNALDGLRGRTGNGIWIHGVPRNTWTRAPLSSRGCVTIANRDFERLMGRVEAGTTPVIFADQLNWVQPQQLEQEQGELLLAIQQWAEDWQSLNTGRYLAHYSESFVGQEKDFATWKEHKYRVNERKEWINIELEQISLFKDPKEDVVVATFLQNYQSNNFSSQGYKRQYWQRQTDGSWKILLENSL